MAAGCAALVGGVCCNNSGSLAKFDAMRLASSLVNSFAGRATLGARHFHNLRI